MQHGQLDELDEAAVDQILAGSLAPPFMFEACRTDNDGDGCGAAHAGGQHMQRGDLASMTEVQAMAQHLLHAAAAAAAAAETNQPKKKQRTGYSFFSSRTVHTIPVPHAAHGPTLASGLFAERPLGQGPPAAAPSLHASHGRSSKGPPPDPPQPQALPQAQVKAQSRHKDHKDQARPQARPRSKQPESRPLPQAQPHLQIRPKVAASPSNCVTTRRAAASAARRAAPEAAPSAPLRPTSRAAPAAAASAPAPAPAPAAAASAPAPAPAPAAAAPAAAPPAPAPAPAAAAPAAAPPAPAPAAAPALQSQYQDGQVVWGKCGHWPWWPATVSYYQNTLS